MNNYYLKLGMLSAFDVEGSLLKREPLKFDKVLSADEFYRFVHFKTYRERRKIAAQARKVYHKMKLVRNNPVNNFE